MSDEKERSYVELEGSLVLAGHRVGVQIGAHPVIYVDGLLAGLVGKHVRVLVEERSMEP